MNNKYKGLIMVIYSVAIIGVFLFLLIEPLIGLDTDTETTRYMLSIASVQLGLITAWLYNNNNNNKKK